MARRSEGLILALALAGCGGASEKTEAPVGKVTAEDEISTVGRVWLALEEERGVPGGQSSIALYEQKRRTTLELGRGKGAGEHIEIRERIEMTDGRSFECKAEKRVPVSVRYGRRHDQPAIEVRRPPLVLARACLPAGYPEREIQLGAEASRFLLRDERLVGFAPVSEKRVYLPSE